MASPIILVTGATGFLGPFVVGALRARGVRVVTTARSGGDAPVDLTRPNMLAAVVEALAPDRVVNLMAMARLADCEADPARAERVNASVPGELAARFGPQLLHVSTDLVFDGRGGPYDENAPPAPLSVYGQSKALGEERVLAHGGRVVRLPLLFGPDAAGRGASEMVVQALRAGQRLPLYTNEYRTPLHAADAAEALGEIVLAEAAPSLLHVAGPERLSRWELGRRIALAQGLEPGGLEAVECHDPLRPRDVALQGRWPCRRSLAAMLREL
jgi:dTDP-4-dehydrorhamnose reductase